MKASNSTMKLLNCRRCDDIVKLIEDKYRSCECGACQGVTLENGRVLVAGPARVLEIGWEAYDGIAEGEVKLFGVLPIHKY